MEMATEALRVCMFGEFSLSLNGQTINDSDNRSKKIWLLLAYMIYFRNRGISQEELIELLWGDEESSSNPINALKTMFHRTRSMLDRLGAGTGHTLIVHRQGDYTWNPDLPFSFDVDEFDAGCQKAKSASDDEARIEAYLRVLPLYRGDFLPKLASCPWVVPINAYFHNLYIQSVHEVLSMLEARGRMDEAVVLSRQAIQIEPCDESLYYHLMRQLLELGNQQAAASVYESMSEMLFDRFGVMPSEEIKALYREALHSSNQKEIDISSLRDQLREPSAEPGALQCDYELFKAIYRAEARSVARSGEAAHIGLLTVGGNDGKALVKRSLDCAMDNLSELVRLSLRRGDVFARCSISQYILLLPQANFENSRKVMERIIKAFSRQYPHSPAVLHYSVQPLDPTC